MAAHSIPRSARVLLTVLMLVAVGCTPTGAVSPAPTTGAISTAALSTTLPPTPAPTPAFPVTLTDDEGTAVTIPAEPHKIVSLTPATTEILFAIGAGDRVVGKIQDPANFPPEAAAVPEVGSLAVNVEKVIALAPDLVVAGGTGLTQGDAVEQLRRANIPVVVTYPTTIAQGLAGIKLIGTAVGLPTEATSLADGIKTQMDQLAALAATATDQPRLFYEIDTTGGIFTPPADSIYGEMFKLAGSKPIAGDASYSISLEKLVAADPEVILLGDAAYGATADAVKARAGWGGMAAVKSGRIVPVDDIVITRPGPRLAQGLYDLIRAIHPDMSIDIPGISFPAVPVASAGPS